MDACRIFLLLLSLVSFGGQSDAAPVPSTDVLLLLPQAGVGAGGMQFARLMRMPAHALAPSGMPQRSAGNQIPPFVPQKGQLVLLKPVTVLGPHPAVQPHQQLRGAKVIPRPLSVHPNPESRQSITQTRNQNEVEPQNPEQSIDLMNRTTSAGVSNSTDLTFYFPVKVNGSTVFVQRNVTVPISVTNEEDLTDELIAGESGGKSAGTSLHGLTRAELSEIISTTVLQVLRQTGHLTSPATTEATASTSAAAEPGQKQEDDGQSEEPGGGAEPPAAASADEGSADGSGESGSADAEAETTATQTRRQLPGTGVRRKQSGKKRKSENGHAGVLKIFKPISTTPDPEAMSPVDQPDMMDPLSLTDLQDELLRNKQIVIVDRDKHKNQLFLKAIREVLLDFEKMYEIPHDEDLAADNRLSQIQSSSSTAADSLELTSPVPLSVAAPTATNETQVDGNSQEGSSTQVPLN